MRAPFSKFIQTFLLSVSLTADEKRTLQQFRFSSGTYADFAEILRKQPLLEEMLLNAANEVFESRLGRKIDSLQSAMSMLGYQPTRNFLSALLLGKSKNLGVIPPDQIEKIIQYALKGEAIPGLDPILAHEHFIGGLIYDALTLSASSSNKSAAVSEESESNSFEITVQKHWEKSIKTSEILRKLAIGLVPKLKLEREVTIDGLLYEIGNLPYVYLEKSSETSIAASLPSPEIMGHLILWNFGFLEDTSWVALWHHEPFLAKKQGDKTYIRAMLVWLVHHLLRYRDLHRTRNLPPRILKNWYEATKPAFPQCSFEAFTSILKMD